MEEVVLWDASKDNNALIYLHPRVTDSDSESGLSRILRELGMTKRKDGSYEKWIASLEKWKQDEEEYVELLEAVLDSWKRKKEESNSGDIDETQETS